MKVFRSFFTKEKMRRRFPTVFSWNDLLKTRLVKDKERLRDAPDGSHQSWSKLKIVTIQWMKSRVWDTIDDWYINNLAKNQVTAVFHSRVICRSVSLKFIELCMETPCLCSFRGTQTWQPKGTNMAAAKKQKHLSLTFAVETKNYCSRDPTHRNNCFFYCKHCLVSKH